MDLGKNGPWTETILQIIFNNPGKSASWIAEQLMFEKDWLKPNIRKLKNLGLTISLPLGYKVSPRGKVLLQHWNPQ